MVHLAQTAATVAAIEAYNALPPGCQADAGPDEGKDTSQLDLGSSIPPETEHESVPAPELCKPITHTQLIRLSRILQRHYPNDRRRYRLETLLQGAAVHVPTTTPSTTSKPEKSSEYLELMARLRAEEESRAYDRMIAVPSVSSSKNPFAIPAPSGAGAAVRDRQHDEMALQDVNRQLTLIFNILVSVVACGIAIWLVSSAWSAPGRLAFAMTGALAVGVAEVVVWNAYLRKVEGSKRRERGRKERRVVEGSWVLEARPGKAVKGVKERVVGGEEVRQRSRQPKSPTTIPGM